VKPALKIGSLVLRGFAVAVAAMCIAWGIAPSSGIAAAIVGAVFGVVIGQLLGRSRVRLPAIVGLAALFAAAAFLLASVVVGHEAVPRAIGTGMTLRGAIVLRFGAAALAAFTALRAVATRRPSALVLELSAIAGSIAYVFAAHREGIISRPLWLSDWAWERGIDPVHVFLVLGGVAVVVLGLLLVAEAEERRGSAAAVLALLAVLGVVLVVVIGPPKAEPMPDLGLTSPNASGSASASAAPSPPAPPRPPPSNQPDGGSADGGAQPQDQNPDGGAKPQDQNPDGGAQPQDQNPDGGSKPQDAKPDGGSDGGDSDGGKPPPPPASEELQNEKEESNESPSPMAVVLLDNDYSPPSQVYYFRQEAWSQWNGTKLVRTSRADVDLDGLESFPTEEGPVRDPVDPLGREVVRGQVVLLVEHTRPFALESPVRFGPLQNPNPSRFVRAYGFESRAQSVPYKDLRGRTAGNPAWSDEVRAYYLQTSDDPRFTALAKAIVSGMPEKNRKDPFRVAVAVKLFLDDNYKYSRKEKHSGVPDPTADFLFGNHIGYCVHFSHAAVLLWRSLGLPSRVGTGYASEEKNRQGGSAILVRAADAHAWPEIYLEGAGWVVLDITPHENLDDQPPPVDDDLQRLLGEMARQLPPDPTKTERREPVKPKEWARAAGTFLGATACALLVMLYLAKLWRRAAPLWARPRSLPRVGYRTSLDLLSEAGFSRERGESREAFAERVRAKLPAFEKLTAMHLAGQLGAFGRSEKGLSAPPPSPPPPAFSDQKERTRAAWREAIEALRTDLVKVPLAWRMLGWINPLSFFRSR
jgi:transglutaminase-like putative cysteine protease